MRTDLDSSTCEVSAVNNRGLKRRSDPSAWKRNVAKVRKASGKEYVSISTDKHVSKKKISSCLRVL